ILVGNVAHGTLSLNTNGAFVYTPTLNYAGSDTFTYRATDGALTSDVATVSITVIPVNDPPVAVNDSTNTLEDIGVTIKALLNDSDVEGNTLTITAVS